MSTLLTIAPAHFIYDERVLRTVGAAGRFDKSYYAVDHAFYHRLGPERDAIVEAVLARLPPNVEVRVLPPWPLIRGLSRATRQIYAFRVGRQARALNPSVVHIHESGILGLMIAFWIRRFLPHARIIYDYHDWIPSEIAATVRNVGPLYQAASLLSLPYVRRLARAVDVAVCISPGQAEWTRAQLGIKKTEVVQNVRPRRTALEHQDFSAQPFAPKLLFAGNVMRIRRLEFIVDVVAELRSAGVDVTLDICGDLTEPDYVAEVQAHSQARGVASAVRFHGRYRGDQELAQHLTHGTVGITMALAEVIPTDVNRIASANKLFTYFALGLPVLIEASYQNMWEITDSGGAGAAFTTVADCVSAALGMWQSPAVWGALHVNALRLADSLNSESYSELLQALYDDLAGPTAPGTPLGTGSTP